MFRHCSMRLSYLPLIMAIGLVATPTAAVQAQVISPPQLSVPVETRLGAQVVKEMYKTIDTWPARISADTLRERWNALQNCTELTGPLDSIKLYTAKQVYQETQLNRRGRSWGRVYGFRLGELIMVERRYINTHVLEHEAFHWLLAWNEHDTDPQHQREAWKRCGLLKNPDEISMP